MPIITAFVLERSSPLPPVYPNVLMYALHIKDGIEATPETILNMVAEVRFAELFSDDPEDMDASVLREIREGLSLQFTLEGEQADVAPVQERTIWDFRARVHPDSLDTFTLRSFLTDYRE